MSSVPVTNVPVTHSGKSLSKGEINFTSELEEILKRITEIKNIAGKYCYPNFAPLFQTQVCLNHGMGNYFLSGGFIEMFSLIWGILFKD